MEECVDGAHDFFGIFLMAEDGKVVGLAHVNHVEPLAEESLPSRRRLSAFFAQDPVRVGLNLTQHGCTIATQIQHSKVPRLFACFRTAPSVGRLNRSRQVGGMFGKESCHLTDNLVCQGLQRGVKRRRHINQDECDDVQSCFSCQQIGDDATQ